MPVKDHDTELLTRADAWPHRRYDSNSATGDLIAELAAALRAALAARSQPTGERWTIDGHVVSNGAEDVMCFYDDRVPDPPLARRILALLAPAVAGSAAPTGDNDE